MKILIYLIYYFGPENKGGSNAPLKPSLYLLLLRCLFFPLCQYGAERSLVTYSN